MRLIIFIATFLCIAHAIPNAVIEQLGFKNPLISSKDCKAPGKQCANCGTAIWCAEDGNGGYDVEVIEECDLNKYKTCLNGQCTDAINPPCNTASLIQFPCTDVGMFPDPYDCTAYHACCSEGTKSNGEKCTGLYYYDAVSTYCKLNLPANKACPPNTLYQCKNVGDVLLNIQNQSIYYVCVYITDKNNNQILYPKSHLCPNGKKFTVATSKCT